MLPLIFLPINLRFSSIVKIHRTKLDINISFMGGAEMVERGNVVMETKIGNTKIYICDDYCRDKTKNDVDKILARIARNAIGNLRTPENNNAS